MIPKPKHLGVEYASVFKDQRVVEAYQYRPMYPPEVFDILMSLVQQTDKPWRVLDAGCGTGFITRQLAPSVDEIDAVDFSEAMIATGKTLPGGDHPNIRWTHGAIEDASLRSSYSLIVAAASFHWMEWEIVLPKFAQILCETGYFAIVEDRALPTPWDKEIGVIINRYSMNKEYVPYDIAEVMAALEQQGLFEQSGMTETQPTLFQQTTAEWIESYHARNGFSRDRMAASDAAAFDQQMQEVINRYCQDGIVARSIKGRVLWGKPKAQRRTGE
ncbi:MAG: class I SAM-dependent methyltransferase [Chloroflexota bacterium]